MSRGKRVGQVWGSFWRTALSWAWMLQKVQKGGRGHWTEGWCWRVTSFPPWLKYKLREKEGDRERILSKEGWSDVIDGLQVKFRSLNFYRKRGTREEFGVKKCPRFNLKAFFSPVTTFTSSTTLRTEQVSPSVAGHRTSVQAPLSSLWMDTALP